jgi:hypothetical protein
VKWYYIEFLGMHRHRTMHIWYTTYHTVGNITVMNLTLTLSPFNNLMKFKLPLIAGLLMQLQNMHSRLSVTHYELR